MKHGDARLALAQEIARARRALGVERAAPLALVPAVAVCAWLAASLFGVHDVLPPLAASFATIAALAGLAFLTLRATRRWRRPTIGEARARLEVDSRLDLGSLEALDDQPVKLDPMAMALWRRAQAEAETLARRVVAAKPRPTLKRADPLRLRWLAPLVVLVGLIVAGPVAGDRALRALLPDPGPLVGDGPVEIEGWAAPAAYTGAAPVPLSDKIGARVQTPPQIEVTLRVTGPRGAPKLVFDGAKRHEKITFARAADGAWEAKLAIDGPGDLRIVRFLTKARWRIEPTVDAPPKARFVNDIEVRDGKIVFTWAGSDDYGVRSAWLALTPVDPPPGLVGAAPERTLLDSPAAEPRSTQADVDLDLMAHAYAGMEVEARIVVGDALGQEAQSEPVRVKLPEPIFLQPLAQAAIEIRKIVLHEKRAYAPLPSKAKRGPPATMYWPDTVWGAQELVIATDDQDPRLERAPDGVRRAVRMIDGLTIAPQDGYFVDAAVFAGFKAARATLANAKEIDGTRAAADILWEVANRAEYGDSADARKALEMAKRALSEAMARGASEDEINRLTQALSQAMKDYVQALTQEAIREGKTAETREDAQEQSTMSQADMQQMLDEVKRLNQEGRTAEAQALLQQLAQMLDNLEVRLANGPGEGQGGDQQRRELDQAIENLSDTIGKQRALRDDTQRSEQSQGRPEQGAETPGQLAERQEQLRRELEKAQKGAQGQGGQGEGQGQDDAAEQLGKAGKSMQEAEEALRRGDVGKARAAQDEALKSMRSGAEQLSQRSASKSAGQNGKSGEEGEGARDPLGRQMGAGIDGGQDTGVPETMQRERARDILDELRRRAQDPRRPESEREYLRRLLERFTGS